MRGYRLVDGEYERLTAVESIDRTLALSSEVLGLELRAKAGGEMRFRDLATGEDLLSHGETHVSWREAAAARQAAELRAERERMRAVPPRRALRSWRHACERVADRTPRSEAPHALTATLARPRGAMLAARR